jgi:hypothetical protein
MLHVANAFHYSQLLLKMTMFMILKYVLTLKLLIIL